MPTILLAPKTGRLTKNKYITTANGLTFIPYSIIDPKWHRHYLNLSRALTVLK